MDVNGERREALEEAVAAVEALPADARYRGVLAAALIEHSLPHYADLSFDVLRRYDALIHVVEDSAVPAGPSWPRTRALARAVGLAAAGAAHDLADPEAALAEIDRLSAEVSDQPGRMMLESARLAVTIAQGAIRRDDPVQTEAWDRMRRLIEQGGPSAAPLGELLGSLHELSTGTSDDMAGRIRTMRDSLDRMPADSPVRAVAEQTMAQLSSLSDGAAGTAELNSGDSALDHTFAAMRLLAPGAEPTGPELSEGVRRLRAALESCSPDHPQRPFFLFGLAMGLVRRSEATNDVADLPEAEGLLIEARGLVRGPQDGLWPMIHGLLSEIRERAGASLSANADAAEGLRTYFWQVLMQPDAAGANTVAREAASSALTAARRCLRVNDPVGAVRALDAGRGLALYAATEMRSVGERLTQAGHPALARRWHESYATGSPPAAGLRREMIEVLSSAAPGGKPLEPPSAEDIRRALAGLAADALVYLMPGGEGSPGYAVAVPACGPPAYIGLPYLRPDHSPEVAAYLAGATKRDTALIGRDLGALDSLGSLDREFAGGFDGVGDWAWRAAMGPLIDNLVPALRGRPRDRVPRLVLIPMGELALIPWAAARRRGGEYALRSVALSYTASARLLCLSADRPAVPPSRIALVVGDPDTQKVAVPLPGARSEAYEIRRRFYRGGRYLGRRPGDDEASPSGRGTADEVRAWLADRGPAAGTTLHLACHGVVDPATAASYLLLAGGEPLAADRLLDLMTGTADRLIGLVVLAACSTGLAAGVYDEAYSLGTAFLAGGACSVLSTLWTIPDAGTSLLMFMFHHFRVAERRPVWEALHEAQLWMINPRRAVPDSMPEALSRQLSAGDPADVTAWAGFLHGGR